MKVFISWSGNSSHRVALLLRDWLQNVIPNIDPWVSSEDIEKGARWGIELAKQLDESSFGIICVVPSNINSSWLNFEAGALSKSIKKSCVIPFLVGIDPSDLDGPLAQFQATKFIKEDVHKLIKSINQELGTESLSLEKLDNNFQNSWQKLKDSLRRINTESKTIQTVKSPTDRKNAVLLASRNEKSLSEAENGVLVQMANNVGGIFSSHELSTATKIPIPRIEYALEKLKEKGWVEERASANYPWTISNKNRKTILKYLVDYHLV